MLSGISSLSFARCENEIIVSLLPLTIPDAFQSSFWALLCSIFVLWFIDFFFFSQRLPFLSHISPSKCVFVRRRSPFWVANRTAFVAALPFVRVFRQCNARNFKWKFIDRKEKHEKL
jgi:hypothetical protein